MVLPPPSAGDSFISDDEEELCPLCVEEFDISDKNFKPCPCGYQVCQFCYNNIRQNPQLNGRCPGCRRPYDDESVEYRKVSTEEWKQDHQRQTRREKERKQKEREKKENEQQQPGTKKHLAGMRVIQKNLVYVIGLNPSIPTDELHNTLRGDQFFGQYGKIQKIVINRRTNANGNPGLGVYVTFSRKEDAARCIAAVDGSINDSKYLRAAYGTTKYCSSYLRGQPCPNPNCMFLHEPGEEADSYTRQDLSTIQHAARQGLQRPSGRNNGGNSRAVSSANLASHSAGSEVQEQPPALPPTVSWAQKAAPAASPAPKPTPIKPKAPTPTPDEVPANLLPQPEPPAVPQAIRLMAETLENLSSKTPFSFAFSSPLLKEEELKSGVLPSFFSFSPKHTVLKAEDFAKFDATHFTNLIASFNNTGGLGSIQRAGLSDSMPLPHQSEPFSDNTQPFQVLPVDHVPEDAKTPFSRPEETVKASPVATATPPPGLFGAGIPAQANQNSQELLAHLMNGGSRGEQS